MNYSERQELVRYRILKARETFNEVNLHISNGLWNTAVNRLYYACFYAVNALLIDKEIQPQTHSGVRQMFGLHFIKTGIIDNSIGKFFTDIYDLRQSSDYDDYVAFNHDIVMDLINPANELITKIESIIYSE
ncbi:MAG TPA: DNA-binding protein [Prolixibacteraceae bacterium]|nr:DNA-binding protein [Prolixibacteraceae bacterium]